MTAALRTVRKVFSSTRSTEPRGVQFCDSCSRVSDVSSRAEAHRDQTLHAASLIHF
ncbi:hypothetical protein RND61_16950 [Streptomyces sp. TRM76323]|uniref:Uncharacterized protein n=1 Tax=Streptomyces tamarix TaxID=3078565 RepID=A0ABU3QMT1_9ACTN|nr:hypothetical protein [Streptomyces tamarix]MDT9683737.1 hypothetical protein [Streptomyces tamarix]